MLLDGTQLPHAQNAGTIIPGDPRIGPITVRVGVIQGHAPGIEHPNYSGIEKLTDEDFLKYYLEHMKSYDFWKDGKSPKCGNCLETISGPDSMARYFGMTLHLHGCFPEVYHADKHHLPPYQQRYFGRLVGLIEESK